MKVSEEYRWHTRKEMLVIIDNKILKVNDIEKRFTSADRMDKLRACGEVIIDSVWLSEWTYEDLKHFMKETGYTERRFACAVMLGKKNLTEFYRFKSKFTH
jgi:hypothetical protein